MKKFIIMKKSAQVSGNARKYSHQYAKIALVEIDPKKLQELGQTEPKSISKRAKGLVRILACGTLFFGKGKRSQGKKFLDLITEKMNQLNAQNSEKI